MCYFKRTEPPATGRQPINGQPWRLRWSYSSLERARGESTKYVTLGQPGQPELNEACALLTAALGSAGGSDAEVHVPLPVEVAGRGTRSQIDFNPYS